MQHLDEGTIHAWLDGELPPAEREAMEAHVASCEQCAATVAEARGFVAASSRILTALDAVPGGVLPASSQESNVGAKPPRFTVSRTWIAVAAVLVLSTVSVIAIRSSSDSPLAKLDEARATRADAPLAAPAAEEPVAMAAATPAEKSADTSKAVRPPAPEQSQVASSGARKSADKSLATVTLERRNARESAFSAQSNSIADASPAASAGVSAKSELPVRSPSPAPSTNLDAKIQRDSSPVSALAAQSPRAAVADSGRKRPPRVLQQVVVTGAGTTSTGEKIGNAIASNDAPQLISKSTSTEAGDTVVTTVYAVSDGTVTLIERSSARDELRRARNSSFSDQVMAKARESTPVNSISWSDSSGHTRTLRGALAREELERVRAALFGPTP
jgi:hypothetical protein